MSYSTQNILKNSTRTGHFETKNIFSQKSKVSKPSLPAQSQSIDNKLECRFHKMPIKSYCSDCQIRVCKACLILNNHETHVLMNDLIDQTEEPKDTQKLKTKIDKMQISFSKNVESFERFHQSEINRTFTTVLERVKEIKDSLLFQLKQFIADSIQKPFKDLTNDTESLLKQVNSSVANNLLKMDKINESIKLEILGLNSKRICKVNFNQQMIENLNEMCSLSFDHSLVESFSVSVSVESQKEKINCDEISEKKEAENEDHFCKSYLTNCEGESMRKKNKKINFCKKSFNNFPKISVYSVLEVSAKQKSPSKTNNKTCAKNRYSSLLTNTKSSNRKLLNSSIEKIKNNKTQSQNKSQSVKKSKKSQPKNESIDTELYPTAFNLYNNFRHTAYSRVEQSKNVQRYKVSNQNARNQKVPHKEIPNFKKRVVDLSIQIDESEIQKEVSVSRTQTAKSQLVKESSAVNKDGCSRSKIVNELKVWKEIIDFSKLEVPESVISLVSQIDKQTHIYNLNLSDNNMDDSTFGLILKQLDGMTVESISLENNLLSAHSMDKLSEFKQTHPFLRDVFVKGNPKLQSNDASTGFSTLEIATGLHLHD